jgi:hypothetical protein
MDIIVEEPPFREVPQSTLLFGASLSLSIVAPLYHFLKEHGHDNAVFLPAAIL